MRLKDPNVVNARAKKRVAIVIANPAVSTTTGWLMGFWWSELTHAHHGFTETPSSPQPHQDSSMNVSFFGYGNVGLPLAQQLHRLGHRVTLAARDAGSDAVRAALARNPGFEVAAPEAAVCSAEAVFLATPYAANADALATLSGALAGKVLVDCTNQVGPGLSHGLQSRQSGSQAVQALALMARVVKAFSIYGFENLDHIDGRAATRASHTAPATSGPWRTRCVRPARSNSPEAAFRTGLRAATRSSACFSLCGPASAADCASTTAGRCTSRGPVPPT